MNYKSAISERLKEYFETSKYTDKQAFNALSLYIYSLQAERNDLYMLAKLLPEDAITKLVSYYDGDSMKIPSKEDYKISRLLAVCFFLKEIQKWDWKEIKDFLNISDKNTEIFSTVSLGKKINLVKEELLDDMGKLLKNIDSTKVKNFIKKYLREIENE